MIGLPDQVTACLFDLDGVLTSTAALHERAWQQTFDELLRERGLPPFTEHDYASYVDGRPRDDGVRTFLASRGITPSEADVKRIGDTKNVLLQEQLAQRGVQPFPGSVRFLDAARAAGLKIAVVTSSANGKAVLDAAGLTPYVQARIDGLVIAQQKLRGKPAPDSFLAGAQALGVPARAAAVFEDALAGVQAGRDGGFGFVVGVDRLGQAEELREHGADVVVEDLAELL